MTLADDVFSLLEKGGKHAGDAQIAVTGEETGNQDKNGGGK